MSVIRSGSDIGQGAERQPNSMKIHHDIAERWHPLPDFRFRLPIPAIPFGHWHHPIDPGGTRRPVDTLVLMHATVA
jgi:hypothetical protein